MPADPGPLERLQQGHQNKGTILQPRMREHQIIGCVLHLFFERQIAPKRVVFRIGVYQISKGQKIHIKRARPPALAAVSAMGHFDRMAGSQKRPGVQFCLDYQSRICEIRAAACGIGRGRENVALPPNQSTCF